MVAHAGAQAAAQGTDEGDADHEGGDGQPGDDDQGIPPDRVGDAVHLCAGGVVPAIAVGLRASQGTWRAPGGSFGVWRGVLRPASGRCGGRRRAPGPGQAALALVEPADAGVGPQHQRIYGEQPVEVGHRVGVGPQPGEALHLLHQGPAVVLEDARTVDRRSGQGHEHLDHELVAASRLLDRAQQPLVELVAPEVGQAVGAPVSIAPFQPLDQPVALQAREGGVHLADVDGPQGARALLERLLEFVAMALTARQERQQPKRAAVKGIRGSGLVGGIRSGRQVRSSGPVVRSGRQARSAGRPGQSQGRAGRCPPTARPAATASIVRRPRRDPGRHRPGCRSGSGPACAPGPKGGHGGHRQRQDEGRDTWDTPSTKARPLAA